VLHQELTEAGEVIVCTDDGTAGRAGTVTDALADLLATRRPIDVVYAAGPVPMMRAVAPSPVRTG
jgi:NAD(P)H-flavin reductase